jgi:hypothetical protein
MWLNDGRSLYDALGPGFTLLRRDRSVDVAGLVAEAARRGVPFAVLDLDAEEAAALYPRNLVLARPDQHVAWRGDRVPADPQALINLIRGAASTFSVLLHGHQSGAPGTRLHRRTGNSLKEAVRLPAGCGPARTVTSRRDRRVGV